MGKGTNTDTTTTTQHQVKPDKVTKDHNAYEKKRRQKMRDLYSLLREEVPRPNKGPCSERYILTTLHQMLATSKHKTSQATQTDPDTSPSPVTVSSTGHSDTPPEATHTEILNRLATECSILLSVFQLEQNHNAAELLSQALHCLTEAATKASWQNPYTAYLTP